MKIAYLGDFTRLWNEEGIARGFERNGCEVLRVQESDDVEGMLRSVKEFQPDLFLTAKAKIQGVRDIFLSEIKKNYRTAVWHFDLYIGLEREHRLLTDPIFRFDDVFTPDGGNDEKFKKYKINHHTLRQGIAKEFCFREKKEQDIDVIFVGSKNPEWQHREDMCAFLEENYSFVRYGHTKESRVFGDTLNDLYARAKIIVGDSVYSPYYWSNRIYETLGRGGFLLHTKVEGIEEHYTPYKDFIPFNFGDFKGLKEKIDFFLDKPEEREKVQQSGFERTKKDHTLDSRCAEFLTRIQ